LGGELDYGDMIATLASLELEGTRKLPHIPVYHFPVPLFHGGEFGQRKEATGIW
jgi:hypothetical protein